MAKYNSTKTITSFSILVLVLVLVILLVVLVFKDLKDEVHETGDKARHFLHN